jgi:hypothetical protein
MTVPISASQVAGITGMSDGAQLTNHKLIILTDGKGQTDPMPVVIMEDIFNNLYQHAK